MERTEQSAVPTDAATIASIRARQHGTVSTRPNAPPVEMRSALRVEDVDALLDIVTRQRALLSECETALTATAEYLDINAGDGGFYERGVAWGQKWGRMPTSALVAAIRDLAEEVRR
jgi:hypothetical protein